MGLDPEEAVSEVFGEEAVDHESAGTLCLHAFSDLTHVSPVVFLYLLKECYIHGTCKATQKFQKLQHQVSQVLRNNPQPGPATFVVQCLHVLPVFGFYDGGFNHLIISALRRFLKTETPSTSRDDLPLARRLAARLFLVTVRGSVDYDEKVMIKILEVLDIPLTSIDEALCHLEAWNGHEFDSGSSFLEWYISNLIISKSYMTAISLLEHFSIRFPGEAFLHQMVESKDFHAAEKWATFMGKPSLCVLVQEFGARNMLKHAYKIIKKNNLQEDFPDLYYKCRESSVKHLAEKACWDVAEAKANGDRQLLEYLVYMAMEAGYTEKGNELCDRYSLEGFAKAEEIEVGFPDNNFLSLDKLAMEDIVWVDEVDELRNATSYIEKCKVVGVDCEWKPNFVKGGGQNKVSIMQIASDCKIFIFDLIKLSNDAPKVLDNCLTQILQSSGILKLGYNLQCDIKQLARSYEELECFKQYDMLLDIQNVFKERCGGLSGLSKKVLGEGLNKTRRNSDWEQRPLSRNQIEYAALDAAVLIRIFHHLRDHPQSGNISETQNREWKSNIVSRMDNPKKTPKERKLRRKSKAREVSESKTTGL